MCAFYHVFFSDPDYNKSLREYASLMNDLCLVKADKGFAAEVMDQLLIYRINRERVRHLSTGNLFSLCSI